ncbi:MAG: hypothetical protein AB7V62_17245 [Thermoleophilia bacterium]
MAKRKKKPRRDHLIDQTKAGKGATTAAGPSTQRSRLLVVLTGVVLGAIWGTVMWGIAELVGADSGVAGWAYSTVTVAMIGGGVAAFFGATWAARRGERISPRLRRRDPS